jgi:hypothetical protein
MPEPIDGPSVIRKRKGTLKKLGSTLKRTLSKSPKKQKDLKDKDAPEPSEHNTTEKGSEEGD